MSGLKEIRRRIRSIKSTKKITYAMKLVSAVKLRKAQEALLHTREYVGALGAVLVKLLQDRDASAFSHPLMCPRPVPKRVCFLVIGGSRGLCGAYNMNVNKAMENMLREKKQAGIESDCILFGKKVAEYFRLRKMSVLKSFEKLPDNPDAWPVEAICKEVEDMFISGKVDGVFVVYTKFRSAMSVHVVSEKLLPLDQEMLSDFIAQSGEPTTAGQTLFEPSAEALFGTVVPLCVRARFRQVALEAKTSEHGCRMTAMESATKNAGELIDKLTLQHNKLRQSGITAEILDIIGGSEAAVK